VALRVRQPPSMAALPSPRDNGLLAALPEHDLACLVPHLEPVVLAFRQTLFEPHTPVDHILFPTSAVLSLVIMTTDGRTAEAATVGREGVVGAVGGAAVRRAFARGVVQVAGPALRIEMGRLEAVRAASPALSDLLHRYADALLAQVLQSVACNALHSIEARCARWILLTLDRMREGEAVPLTQEHLAEMLGAHRVTVATALRDLEAAGLIRRGRLRLLVVDRDGLERRACECYSVVRAHFRGLFPMAHLHATENTKP
jgi:CRP-like cAMP-binding protein